MNGIIMNPVFLIFDYLSIRLVRINVCANTLINRKLLKSINHILFFIVLQINLRIIVCNSEANKMFFQQFLFTLYSFCQFFLYLFNYTATKFSSINLLNQIFILRRFITNMTFVSWLQTFLCFTYFIFQLLFKCLLIFYYIVNKTLKMMIDSFYCLEFELMNICPFLF